MLNVSARQVEILIDGVDFTPCLISGQGSDNHLDQSGLISFSGQLELGRPLGFAETLDDRKNPRFCRGKTVIISYADTAGSLQRHPRGALRILKATYDDETKRLTLELGDLISLLNFKEPTDPDKADNKSCEGKTAAQVITSLLAEAGITNIAGDLPSTRYNYPLNISGSYLDAVGKILYANNRFGWIDKNEVFQVRRADISGGGAGIAIEVGVNEIWYKRLEGAEAPVEKVKAVGNEITVTPAAEYLYDESESYGPASTVNIRYNNTTVVLERVKRTEEWSQGSCTKTITVETYEPYGLVIPEIFWGELSPLLSLIVSERNVAIYRYESNKEGRLSSKTEKTYRPRATYLAEYKEAKEDAIFSITTLVLTKEVQEGYEYSQKNKSKDEKEGYLKSIKTETYEKKIIILNGTDEDWAEYEFPPEEMIRSEVQTQTWKQPNKDTWEYKSSLLRSLVRVNPDLVKFQEGSNIISNKTNLISDKEGSTRRVSNSGQEQPPAPERKPTECNIEEEQIEEFQLFSDRCASELKSRERTFTVEFLAGKRETVLSPGEVTTGGGESQAKKQLKEIALREGRLLKGREKGQEIATNLRDILFDYHPLMPVYCKELEGNIQAYLADGCSWVFTNTRALWSCDGIWVSTLAGTPDIEDGVAPSVSATRPWAENIQFSLGVGQGIAIRRYEYELVKITLDVACGTGHEIDIQIQSSFNSIILTDLASGHGINIQIQPAFDSTISIELGSGHNAIVIRAIVITLSTGHGLEIQKQQQGIRWRDITFTQWRDLDANSWRNIIF